MGNTVSNQKMSVANASVHDIYVKLGPKRSRPKLVKAVSKRMFKTRSAAYLDESTETEKDISNVIRPCKSHTFSGLGPSNYLTVEAKDENGEKHLICFERQVDTRSNQIFVYTMLKKSRKGHMWIDKENNDYKNHFDNIHQYLNAANLFRRDLEIQIATLKQDLHDMQLSRGKFNKKMLHNIISELERNPECVTCERIIQKAESTEQCEDVIKAPKTNENVCDHVKDLLNWDQNPIYQKKLKIEEEIGEKTEEIIRLENTMALDDLALSLENSFQPFKEKLRTQLQITILSNPHNP